MSKEIVKIHIVSGVVIRRDGQYLLVQEKSPKAYGLWNLPAGRVEVGDTLEETAVKEAQEETGFQVKLIRKLVVNQDTANEPTKHAYEAEIISGELRFPEDELLDVQWFTYEEVKQLCAENKLRVPWVMESINKVQHA